MPDNFVNPTPIKPANTNIDLARVTIGAETFRNPFFYVFIGVAVTLAVQYYFMHKKRSEH